jgi:ParB-like chromosome segregation protein Spo0J
MPTIETVALAAIDPNPYRDLKTYPWIERKVEQLMRSIADVGFWEGVIARAVDARFELAFGHHRIEAARRLQFDTVPLIVRPLSDREMLAFMGRENGEDYATDLVVMLNTWEGAAAFGDHGRRNLKPIDIARLLGWTITTDTRSARMTPLAATCAAAAALVAGGHLAREDLAGLSVHAAREIVTCAQERIEQLERIARREGHTFTDTKRAQSIVGKAAMLTARDMREGRIAARNLRTEVNLNTLRVARMTKPPRPTPLFARFGQDLCEQIARVLKNDSAAERISEIVKALPMIELEEDHMILRLLHHELDELSRRSLRAKRWTTPNKDRAAEDGPKPRRPNGLLSGREETLSDAHQHSV